MVAGKTIWKMKDQNGTPYFVYLASKQEKKLFEWLQCSLWLASMTIILKSVLQLTWIPRLRNCPFMCTEWCIAGHIWELLRGFCFIGFVACFRHGGSQLLLRRLSSHFGFGGKVLAWFKSYLEIAPNLFRLTTLLLRLWYSPRIHSGSASELIVTVPLGDILPKHNIGVMFDNTLIFQTNVKAVINHRSTPYETSPRFYRMKLQNFSRCFGCKVITPTSSMNQSEFRVINLLKAREKWRVQCAIKRNNPEIIFAKNRKLNLVLFLVLEPKGPSYKLVWRQIFVWLPTDAEHYFLTNNIHEKISPFWLVKSSAVFFFENSAEKS